MADLEKLLKSLEKLLDKSERKEALDEYVERLINKYKHDFFIESLRKRVDIVMKRVRDARKTFHPVTGITPLVSSMLHSYGDRELYLTMVIFTSKDVTSAMGIDHEQHLLRYDNEDHRLLFPDEFEKRSSILLEKAEEGVLDDLYDSPPYEILHQIIGRHGELLDRLGIQPFDSKIYNGV